MKAELNWIETAVVMAGALMLAWLLGMEMSAKLISIVACTGFLTETLFKLKMQRR